MGIEIARNFPIEEALASRKIPVTNGFMPCPNPAHREKRGRNCSVYPDSNTFYCHACGTHGDVITLVEMLDGVSFPEAVKALGGGDITATEEERCPVSMTFYEKLAEGGLTGYRALVSLFYEDKEAFLYIFNELKKDHKAELIAELKAAVRRGDTAKVNCLQKAIQEVI